MQVRTRLDMGALMATLRAEVPQAHAAFRVHRAARIAPTTALTVD
jgi:hypothetical protein